MNTTRAFSASLLLALCGCASTAPVATDTPAQTLALSWWASPDPAAVARLSNQVEPLRTDPMCLGKRLLEVPDLTHAWWLAAEPRTRASIGEALARAGEPLYAKSAAARVANAADYDQAWSQLTQARDLLALEPEQARSIAGDALDTFRELQDGLLEAEAHMLLMAAKLQQGQDLESESLPACSVAQRPQALLLIAGSKRSGSATVACSREADTTGHGAVLAALDRFVERGILTLPGDANALAMARYRVAARRSEGERALLAANQALRLTRPSDQRGRAEARLAMAQARILLGQPTAGTLEAEAAREITEELGDWELQALAEAQLGQCLLAAEDPEDASLAYARAEFAAAKAGDATARARARLNQATALLAAGEVKEAKVCLRDVIVGGVAFSSEVEARRAILRAMVSLLLGETPAPAAAEQIESSLALARREGAYAVVLRYGSLPKRLREPRGS